MWFYYTEIMTCPNRKYSKYTLTYHPIIPMEINSSNFIFIKLQRMRKCRAKSAVLPDGIKAPLSLTLRRKTKLKEQLLQK